MKKPNPPAIDARPLMGPRVATPLTSTWRVNYDINSAPAAKTSRRDSLRSLATIHEEKDGHSHGEAHTETLQV